MSRSEILHQILESQSQIFTKKMNTGISKNVRLLLAEVERLAEGARQDAEIATIMGQASRALDHAECMVGLVKLADEINALFPEVTP